MELVINKCYGGFTLSAKALKALKMTEDETGELERNDERLVACVKSLKEKASGMYSKLEVVSIPDDFTDYEIDEYDGRESVIYVVDGKLRHAW